ncbi:MAG TPA: CYTH domain-containing protein [Steroidobacteraceae bacterium]|nr:CYTH domain-containing protein [Steroidobacteraceae bacterium]
MPVEIERKFLVVGASWRAAVTRTELFRQGYLATSDACSVRVRVAAGAGTLNIKGRVAGARRAEYEYAIPLAEAEELLALCSEGRIDKHRHFIPHAGHTWEVDEFFGENAGLIVAEVELDDESESLELPPWAGAEVTEDVRYYNSSLARAPWREWGTAPGVSA